MRLTYLVLRLEQVMGNVLLICDKAVCRVLLAYFRSVPMEEMPFLEVPRSVPLGLGGSYSGPSRSMSHSSKKRLKS